MFYYVIQNFVVIKCKENVKLLYSYRFRKYIIGTHEKCSIDINCRKVRIELIINRRRQFYEND